MPVRTCFFDMGNVLVHFSHDLMCRNLAAVSGLSELETRRFLFEDQWQWLMERGERSEAEFCTELARRAAQPLDPDRVCHAAADIFQLNTPIVPLLQQLRDAGLRLILLSNTSVTHLRFIEQHFQVLNLMHDRVTSFSVGTMKPDPRIFLAALEKAGCPPEECFYTDDIEAYIHQARILGIHSHPFTSVERLDHELRRLGMLPS
ncbi:MAG: HAD family hydrolase [Planctomycetaceae bacterium]